MTQPTRLLLASASPRRLELLRGLGLSPVAAPSDLPEEALDGESPREMVLRLAEAKGRHVVARLAPGAPSCVLLAADTAVVLDSRVLGKPRDDEEARAMLRALCGRAHRVLTGVFLLRTDDGRWSREVESTRVRFRRYDEATLRAYVASGEPQDKAGAYAIQGSGSALVEGLEGSWSNVVGLPVEHLGAWLAGIGVDLAALRRG